METHELLSKYQDGLKVLHMSHEQLGHRSVVDYRKEMVSKVNGDISHLNLNVDMPVSFGVNRKLIRSYVSKTAYNPVEMKIDAINKKNDIYEHDFAQVLDMLYQSSYRTSGGKYVFRAKAFQTAVEGTCFEYEGYTNVSVKRQVPDHIDSNNKIQYKEREIVIEKGCYTELRGLLDVVFPNPYENDIQKQPWIIDQKIFDKQIFEIEFANHPIADVKGGITWSALGINNGEDSPKSWLPTINNDKVLVLYYYDIQGNFVIWANGNIIHEGHNPFRHGKYPYVRTIHDQFSGTPFMYGRSFVEQTASTSDTFNVLWNLIIQKHGLSSMPFIMATNTAGLPEVLDIHAGKVVEVEDINSAQINNFPGISQSDIAILNKLSVDMEDLAGNPSGGANSSTPGGGRVLLAQTLKRDEETQQTIGYGLLFLEEAERKRAFQRLSNLMQFLESDKQNKITNGSAVFYHSFRQKNVELSDGEYGTRIIRIAEDRDPIEDIQQQLDLDEVASPENVESVAISIDDFCDITYYVDVVPLSSYNQSQSLEMQKFMQYLETRLAVMPESDRGALMQELDRIMGYEGDKFNPPEQPMPQQMSPEQAMQEQAMMEQQGQQPQLPTEQMM